MNRALQILGLASIAGISAASYYHSIQLKGNFTIQLFKFLSSYNEKYSKSAFEFLTKFAYLQNNGSLDLSNKILVNFDVDGRYLQGLALLGLAGVQVGPISQNPNEDSNDFGLMYTKANIYSMLEKYKYLSNQKQGDSSKTEKLKIGVKIIPDKEVVELAPYLIMDNILNCSRNIMGQFEEQPDEVVQISPNTLNSGQIRMKKAKIPKLADIITIDTEHIFAAVGQQNQKQANIMLNKMFNLLAKQVGKPHQIPIYEYIQNSYRLIYEPLSKKEKQALQFITWRDIIRLIIAP